MDMLIFLRTVDKNSVVYKSKRVLVLGKDGVVPKYLIEKKLPTDFKGTLYDVNIHSGKRYENVGSFSSLTQAKNKCYEHFEKDLGISYKFTY